MCINVDDANNYIMYPLVQAVLSGNTEVPARNLHQHIQNLMQVHIYNYLQYLPRCPHGRCVNTDPGYYCVCDPHYIPTQDRRGCMDGRQGTCYTKYIHYILYTLIYRVSQKRLS